MKYAILTSGGNGRCATTWIVEMLKANALTSVTATHEAFNLDPSRAFRSWERARNGGSLVVDTNTHVRWVLPLINQFDAKLRVLLRDPFDWLQTALSRDIVNDAYWVREWITKGKPELNITHSVLFKGLANLDTLLHITESAAVDSEIWHFDLYTKPDGFRALMQSIDITMKPEMDLNVYRRSLAPAQKLDLTEYYPGDPAKLIDAMLKRFPRVKAAYEKAKRKI